MQKSPPWKLKSRPESGKLQNRPIAHKTAPFEDHCSKVYIFRNTSFLWDKEKSRQLQFVEDHLRLRNN